MQIHVVQRNQTIYSIADTSFPQNWLLIENNFDVAKRV
ncbi:Uncharacterised protein [Paenibacillus macerans]|uniref:Uncharacterized protein n=1 Tax=Paenibacillus macerans TaxID=44252 RepID=A0A090Z6S1_PAEMA|nr:hypothetical protein DJ90_36 [Paenibacillus macerans]SUA85256.1 Uncharacterised protein [Paenibacillus macerans]